MAAEHIDITGKFRLVDADEADVEDFFVCTRLADQPPPAGMDTAQCCDCQQPIFLRPSAPQAPRRICVECLLDRANGGHA